MQIKGIFNVRNILKLRWKRWTLLSKPCDVSSQVFSKGWLSHAESSCVSFVSFRPSVKNMMLLSTPWTWFYLNRFGRDDTCYNFTSENSISVLTIRVMGRVIRISNIDKIFQRSCVRLIYQVVVSDDIRLWSYECVDISLIFQGNFELTINIGVFAILRFLPFGILDTGIY